MTVDSTTVAAQADRQATVACQFCSTLNRVHLSRVDQKPKCGECTLLDVCPTGKKNVGATN